MPGRKYVNAVRDAEIVRLRADGIDPRVIADRYGVTVSRISQIWTKALRDMPARAVEERRNEADEFCTRMIGKLTPLLDDDSVAARTKAELSRAINLWEQRRAALLGLDQPRRREVEIITADTIDRAMRDLTAEVTADAEYQRLVQEMGK
jgi:hypothetical protein